MLSNEIVSELKTVVPIDNSYLYIRLNRFITTQDTRPRTIQKFSFLPSFIEHHPCLTIHPNGLYLKKKDTISDIINELQKYPPLPVFFCAETGLFIPLMIDFGGVGTFLVEEPIEPLMKQEIPGYYRRKLQIT